MFLPEETGLSPAKLDGPTRLVLVCRIGADNRYLGVWTKRDALLAVHELRTPIEPADTSE